VRTGNIFFLILNAVGVLINVGNVLNGIESVGGRLFVTFLMFAQIYLVAYYVKKIHEDR